MNNTCTVCIHVHVCLLHGVICTRVFYNIIDLPSSTLSPLTSLHHIHLSQQSDPIEHHTIGFCVVASSG